MGKGGMESRGIRHCTAVDQGLPKSNTASDFATQLLSAATSGDACKEVEQDVGEGEGKVSAGSSSGCLGLAGAWHLTAYYALPLVRQLPDQTCSSLNVTFPLTCIALRVTSSTSRCCLSSTPMMKQCPSSGQV